MPVVERSSVIVLLYASEGLDARLNTLRDADGFLGAAMFSPVKRSGEALAYTWWRDKRTAEAVLDSGDIAALRATPVEVTTVRLKAAPDDHGGSLLLNNPGMVVLVTLMAVDPTQSDALLEELQSAADKFLPNFRAIRAVAFHRSSDRSLIVEVLCVTGTLALAITQFKSRLRQHRQRVAAIARSNNPDVYRLRRTVSPAVRDQ